MNPASLWSFLYTIIKSPIDELADWMRVSLSLYRAAISAPDLEDVSARNGNASTGQPIMLAKYLTKYWSMTPCLNWR